MARISQVCNDGAAIVYEHELHCREHVHQTSLQVRTIGEKRLALFLRNSNKDMEGRRVANSIGTLSSAAVYLKTEKSEELEKNVQTCSFL